MTKDELVLQPATKPQNAGSELNLPIPVYILCNYDGEPLSEEDFEALDDKIELSKSTEALQIETAETIRKIREVEMDAEKCHTECKLIALYAVAYI